MSDLNNHPAAFKATDPNNWITVITAFAQLFVLIAPLLAQIAQLWSTPPAPPTPQ
jgi:hypothetical protein